MRKYIFISLFLILEISHAFSQQWNRLNNGGISGGGNVVIDLALFRDSLCISGGYTMAGGFTAQNLSMYDSLNWKVIMPGTLGAASDMLVYNNELAIFGSFSNGGGNSNADNIVIWNGSSWTPLTGGSSTNNGTYHDMIIYNGNLICIGPTMMNNVSNLNFVAKWDGNLWSGVGGGVTGGTTDAWSGCVYQNDLYVGGIFYAAGGVPAQCIAKWNGTQWFNVGDANAEVMYMFNDTVNDVLYTCGYFNIIGGVSATGIAKYDGENWYPVGGGLDLCGGWALEIYQNQLYVAGCFLEADGNTNIKYLARFDGQNWNSLNSGINTSVNDLQFYKDELYVGGGFTTAGDTVVTALARWSYPLDSACATMFADILALPDTLFLAEAPFKFKSGCYGNSSLQWNFSDGFTSTIGQPTYNFNNVPGTYIIELIAYCGSTSDTITDTVVVMNNIGINEYSTQSIEMKIYPNPASEEVTIEFHKPFTNETKLEITDITGKMIYSEVTQAEMKKINTSGWSRGNYFVRLLKEDECVGRKSFTLIQSIGSR